MVKNLAAMLETSVWSLGWEDPLEEGMATHPSILAWRILKDRRAWQAKSMGSQRVRHNWMTKHSTVATCWPTLSIYVQLQFLGRGCKYIWRINEQKFIKFDENNKTTDLKSSMNPSTRNLKKLTPRPNIVKLFIMNKEEILKASRKKIERHIDYLQRSKTKT